MLKFTEIILKYPNDAITLHSVFSTGITELDTLPLYIMNYFLDDLKGQCVGIVYPSEAV